MQKARRPIALPQISVLSLVLGLGGCFTDVNNGPRPDAPGAQGDTPATGPDGVADESGPALPIDAAVDAARDVPVPSSGGASGFDAGSEAPGGGGSGGFGMGGVVGGGGSTFSGGIIGSGGGGTADGSVGAGGGGTPVDAPIDQNLSAPVGSPCALDGDCVLGNCVDRVCCATTCTGCNACAGTLTGKGDGTCAPVLGGQDPHNTCSDETATNQCGNDGMCDGAGVCRKVSSSHVCKQASCNGSTFTPASTCDGAGTCADETPEDCGAFQCATTGCLKSCTSQADCGASNYCKISSGSTGICTTRNPNGTPATQPFECTSGVVADGVCCDKACTGCSACSGAPLTTAAAGQCAFVVAGQIAHNACATSGVTCGLDGKCDGAGSCRYSPAEGASCDDPSNLCVTGKVCQNHACTTGTLKTCPPPTLQCRGSGTCVPATGSCNYPIDDNLTCTDGNSCTTDTCQGGTCVGTTILCNNPPACKQSTTCSAGSCIYTQNASNGSTDGKCAGGTPYCYAGACVQCTADPHCSGTRPSCDPTTHSCVCRRKSAANVLTNPGFDGDWSGWTTYTAILETDAEGCPESNSVYTENSENDPWQCFPLSGDTDYAIGGKFKGNLSYANNWIRVRYFTGPNCTGTGDTTWDFYLGYTADWASQGSGFHAPAGTASARIGIYGMGQYTDQLYVNASSSQF